MDIFNTVMFVLQIGLAFVCATNLAPTNTGESKLDRLVVTLLWGGLALDSLGKVL